MSYLQDEIANLIAYWDWENKTADQCAKAILSLIDAQRCVWTADEDGIYHTSCNMVENSYSVYCSKCGKRIEVKEGRMDNLRDIIIEACQDTSLIEVEIEGLADKLETALSDLKDKAEQADIFKRALLRLLKDIDTGDLQDIFTCEARNWLTSFRSKIFSAVKDALNQPAEVKP